MPEFNCKIINDQGVAEQRIITAQSKFDLYDSFDGSDEFIISVKLKKESFDFKTWFIKLQKPKADEIEQFTSQLSALMNAGIPLLGCLEALKDQAQTDIMKIIIQSLYDDLNGGSSLSEAVGKFPNVFGGMYVNMIEAGEKAGVMDTILERLSKFIGKELAMVANIKSAMRYPMIIFGVLVIAFSAAIIYVIPRFASLYKGQKVTLPLPTRILIGVNQAVTDYWFMTAAIAIIIVVGLHYYFKTPRGIYSKDWLLLHMPVAKLIYRNSSMSRFAHMLETLSRSGIQIVPALKTVEKTVGNVVIGNAIGRARLEAEGGGGLAASLGKSKYFPPMTVKMISVGEQSGSLDIMLNKIAEQYDAEVDHVLKRLTALIEPLMTIVMGIFVVIMALGIFLPMWQVYEVF